MSENDSQQKMYCTFDVIASNRDGDVVQRDSIEETGSFTMGDLSTVVPIRGIDEITVELQSVEVRRGETVVQRIERDDVE